MPAQMSAMPEPADPYARALGRFYAFYVEHPLLARAVGAVTWGTSFRLMYRSLGGLRDLAAGATVLDACCGGGLALRWLDPATGARNVGIDVSPAMLERASRVVRRRGFTNAELQLADVEAIPLPNGAAEVALLYNTLHAVPNPPAAAAEVARCMKADGRLVGTMVVRGRGRRADRLIEREAPKENGLIGPGGTSSDLERWLQAAFSELALTLDDTLATFHARRSGAQP
jgi:SAM-dependent methyltransferase